MAYKKYAYYSKGNKIALIQEEIAGGNLEFKDDQGNIITRGSSDPSARNPYKSPQQTVEGGLEIEYTYAPIINRTVPTVGTTDNNSATATVFNMFGYGAVNGCLAFYASFEDDSHFDFDAGALAAEFGTEGTDYILIEGSGRWSGVHKIKELTSLGYIITETKFRELGVVNINLGDVVAATGVIDDDGRGEIARLFPDTTKNYFCQLTPDIGDNNGIYEVTSDGNRNLTIIQSKYYPTTIPTSGFDGKYQENALSAISLSDQADESSMNIHKIYQDECTLYTKDHIDIMQDESFELDLTRYQANAVVYYLQAKKFEDAGDIQKHEYYMSKFLRQLEKSKSSRKYGPYFVQGLEHMRK